MIETLGFKPLFISLILNCVSLATFSIFINSKPTRHITPNLGIRQGGSISLYLFLLCTEGLISLLQNKVHGLKICIGAPSINHLLFVDDSVIFCKADITTNHMVNILLDEYGRVSSHQSQQ